MRNWPAIASALPTMPSSTTGIGPDSGRWPARLRIGVYTERILRDFAFLRDGDRRGHASSTMGQAAGRRDERAGSRLWRVVWLATRLPYLVRSRRHRGQWISVAAQYLGRLDGATRYRLLDRKRP